MDFKADLNLDTPRTKMLPPAWSPVMQSPVAEPPYCPTDSKRAAARMDVAVPARLMWKDQRGTARFATVITRNVSEFGTYVECLTPVSLPLYRLVQFQLEKDVPDSDRLPAALKQGRLTAAIYRVQPPDARGRGQGFALRLMIEPKRHGAATQEAAPEPVRASA